MDKALLERLIIYPILFAVTFISVMACSNTVFRYRESPIKPYSDLEHHKNLLYKISNGNYGDGDVKFTFVDKFAGPQTVGQCWINLFGFQKEVDIHKDTWYGLTTKQKILLLAHEEVHCRCLYFNHIDSLDEDDCQVSFMHPNLENPYCTHKKWARYLKELREGCGYY